MFCTRCCIAASIVGIEIDLPCNLGGLGKSPARPSFRLSEMHFPAFLDEKVFNYLLPFAGVTDNGLHRALPTIESTLKQL